MSEVEKPPSQTESINNAEDEIIKVRPAGIEAVS